MPTHFAESKMYPQKKKKSQRSASDLCHCDEMQNNSITPSHGVKHMHAARKEQKDSKMKSSIYNERSYCAKAKLVLQFQTTQSPWPIYQTLSFLLLLTIGDGSRGRLTLKGKNLHSAVSFSCIRRPLSLSLSLSLFHIHLLVSPSVNRPHSY